MFPDFLAKILGMQQQGGGSGMPFGALGGGLNGSSPSPAIPAAASGGMPMSGVGPGAPPPGSPPQPGNGAPPLNINPPVANGGTGLWPGGARGQSAALGQAMNLIKQPQLQPAPWMQMMPMGTMRG